MILVDHLIHICLMDDVIIQESNTLLSIKAWPRIHPTLPIAKYSLTVASSRPPIPIPLTWPHYLTTTIYLPITLTILNIPTSYIARVSITQL